MPDDDDIIEEEIIDEGNDVTIEVPSDYFQYHPNPAASNLWEDDPNDPTGYYKVPTTDTSPVEGKNYYLTVAIAQRRTGGNSMSETAFAYSTYQTYLMYRTTTNGSYAKLVDIKDYPDMIGEPNMLDATTLSNNMEIKIAGIFQTQDGFTFTANYTPENFTAVKELENHTYDYALWLGGTTAGVPDGSQGKFSWSGDIRAGFPGKGVDEVRDMSITATPTTDVLWSAT